MPKFMITFRTATHWAETHIVAKSRAAALRDGLRLANEDVECLDFEDYDSSHRVEQILVSDASGRTVADWMRPDLRLRLGAPKLLEAIKQALVALNTAPRFQVAGLGDSYAIALICERAIATAEEQS